MSIQSNVKELGHWPNDHRYTTSTLFGLGVLTLADMLSQQAIDRPIKNTVSILPHDIQNPEVLAVVLPGYNNLNGIEMATGLQQAIGSNAVVAYASYQKSGLGLDEIARDLQQVVDDGEYQKIIYYGHSMGGVASSHLGPKIDGYHTSELWLDCSPYCLDDVRAPKWLTKLSLLLPYNGGVLSKVTAMEATDLLEHTKRSHQHVHRKLKDTLNFVINGPTYALNRAQLKAIAKTGMQSDAFDKVYYLRPEDADDDTVVYVESAANNWMQAFPRLETILVKDSKHASVKDHPTEYKVAITNNNLLGKTALNLVA